MKLLPQMKINKKEFNKLTLDYLANSDLKYRKSLGQYFTPRSIIKELLSVLPKNIKNPKVLDPACGTGEFLINAKDYFISPRLYGWEIDTKVARIAKEMVSTAKIKDIDSLSVNTSEKFNFIIGNPPYYEFSPSPKIKQKFGEVINGRVNIFNLFVSRGINLLKENGYLAYVVPPSMNNGAYFARLREFVVKNCNIEYLKIIKDSNLFHGALQTVMLLVLKKGQNKGDYIFRKNGLLIFSEKSRSLKNAFEGRVSLEELGYKVRTGRLIWNQNKDKLTNDSAQGIPLIWSYNITKQGLKLNNHKKLQFAKVKNHDIGPAIVTNRIIGKPGNGKLKAALIPKNMKFVAENHVNVIFYPKNRRLFQEKEKINWKEILDQLNSPEKSDLLQSITGNTQISKTELEKLFPFSVETLKS